MNTISYTSVRSNLSKTMERVCDDHTPIIITRKSEQPVIMISLEDYQSLEETAYLLKSPNNARRLLDSVAEVAVNATLEREIAD